MWQCGREPEPWQMPRDRLELNLARSGLVGTKPSKRRDRIETEMQWKKGKGRGRGEAGRTRQGEQGTSSPQTSCAASRRSQVASRNLQSAKCKVQSSSVSLQQSQAKKKSQGWLVTGKVQYGCTKEQLDWEEASHRPHHRVGWTLTARNRP